MDYWLKVFTDFDTETHGVRFSKVTGHDYSDVRPGVFNSYLYTIFEPNKFNPDGTPARSLVLHELNRPEIVYNTGDIIHASEFNCIKKIAHAILESMNSAVFFNFEVYCRKVNICQLLPAHIYYADLIFPQRFMIMGISTWALVREFESIPRFVSDNQGRLQIVCREMEIEHAPWDISVLDDGRAREFPLNAGATYEYDDFYTMLKFLNFSLNLMAASDVYKTHVDSFKFVDYTVGKLMNGGVAGE